MFLAKHVHTDECIQEYRATIQQYWKTYNPTDGDILRMRIHEYCKRQLHGSARADGEPGRVVVADDGDDAVTPTTTIGLPTPEAHMTATTRDIAFRMRFLLVSNTFP